MKPIALKIKLDMENSNYIQNIFFVKNVQCVKIQAHLKKCKKRREEKKMLSCPYFVYVEKTTKRLKNFAIFWLADTRNQTQFWFVGKTFFVFLFFPLTALYKNQQHTVSLSTSRSESKLKSCVTKPCTIHCAELYTQIPSNKVLLWALLCKIILDFGWV